MDLLLEERQAEDDARGRVEDRARGDRWRQDPSLQRELGDRHPREADGDQRVEMPVDEDLGAVVLEDFDRALGQGGDQAEEKPRRGSQQRGSERPDPRQPRDQEPGREADEDCAREDPLAERRVLPPPGGIREQQEERQARGDHDRGDHVPPGDPLRGEPDSKRQREDDRGREDRLHHDQPAVAERRRLQAEGDPVRDDPGEPNGVLDQAEENPGARLLRLRGIHNHPLLQHRAEREHRRRAEGEDHRHWRSL
jgi:hypothetical protein